MLARKTTELPALGADEAGAPRSAARSRAAIVPIMDRCLAALEAGRPGDALAALQDVIAAVGEAGLRVRAGKRSRAAS